MRPIRNVEYDHWNWTIDETYDDRKSSLKTEMIEEIDEQSEANYPLFKKKLKLDGDIDNIQKLYDDYHNFVTNKNLMEQQKKNALDKAVDSMHDKLGIYNKVRKWKTEISRSLLKEPKEHDRMLKSLCREETEKTYYAGPKGKALQLLEISKKKAKHILNSGLPLDTAVNAIGVEMNTQKINLDLPQNMFNPSTAIEHKK
jgi:hypothetical protein